MSRFLFYDDMLINVIQKEQKPSGGAAVQTLAWIMGLEENKQEVYVLTNLYSACNIKDDFKHIKLLDNYKPNHGIRWIRWIYYRIPYVLKILKRNKPDYLILSIPDWSTFVWAIFCKMLKIKLVVRVSNDNFVDKRLMETHAKVFYYLMKFGFSLSYAIVCQNVYQFNQLKKKYPKKKIAKFVNPFYRKTTQNYRSIKTNENKSYIAWLGLFQYQKNLKLLFKIAKSLNGTSFKIAGENVPGTLDEETKEYLLALDKLSNVEFVGFLNKQDTYEFLSKAKFLLSTSRYEGFSNTFLEAFSCKTPILTNTNVNPDGIIERYALGLVYTDVEDLINKLDEINEEDYNIMKENTVDYLNNFHSYIKLAKQFNFFLNK